MPRYDGGNLNFRLGGGLGRMKYVILFISISVGLSLIGGYLGPPWRGIIFWGSLGFTGISLLFFAQSWINAKKRMKRRISYKPEKTWVSYDPPSRNSTRPVSPPKRPAKPTDKDFHDVIDE